MKVVDRWEVLVDGQVFDELHDEALARRIADTYGGEVRLVPAHDAPGSTLAQVTLR